MPGNRRQHRPGRPTVLSSGEEFNFGPDNSNSDVSDTELPGPTEDTWQAVVLGPNATRRQFEDVRYSPILRVHYFPFLIFFDSNSMQALKEANLKVEEQRLEIRQLRMENSALQREIPKDGSGRPRKNPPPPTVTKNDERIALHGRKFGVMNEIFVVEAAFLVADSGFSPMDNTRYTSQALILQGVIAELFEEVPEDLHGLMKEHTHFRDLVSGRKPRHPSS